ncbi:hypothetical protein [Simkania sp.]|uniref:hypothetical protein n=1 Tax=Simkania sp. TaxID=34094 RepID=UPI003B52E9E4
MRTAKTWGILLLVCLFSGLKVHAEVEIKMTQLQDDKNEMTLHFPRYFEESEMQLNQLLYRIIVSQLPSKRQETFSFVQKDNALYFSGAPQDMSQLYKRVLDIMSVGISEEEFSIHKEGYLLTDEAAQWIKYEDLSEWIELASVIANFAADSYLNAFPQESDLAFTRTELGEEEPRLMFVHDQGTHHFYALRLTSDDCHNISKLIKNMADLNLWELLKKSKDMKKLGRKIEPVHPMRFLGYIFSTHELKKRMPKIKDSHFKWVKFTEGLCDRLSKEARHDNLNRFIPGFAQTVGCSEGIIEDFVRRHDWYGMLDYLM